MSEQKTIFFSRIKEGTLCVSIVLFIISSLIIIMQIFTRYIFSFSFAWVEELSRYLVIYVVMLGSSLVLREDAHPRVELLYDFIPIKIKYWINILFYLLILLFLSVLTWQGIQSCIFAWNDYTAALQIKLAIPYFAIPLGGILMIVQTFYLIIDNYKNFKE